MIVAILNTKGGVGKTTTALNLAMADPTGSDNGAAAGAIPAGIGYLDTPVVRRKAVANASAMGCSILEYPARDEKAAYEYQRLVAAVFGWPDGEVM